MRRLLAPVLAFVLMAGPVYAQKLGQQLAQQAPHLGYVYPAGGKQGSTFNVVVGGQHLSGTANCSVLVDGDCVQAQAFGYERPLTPKELQTYREEASKLQEKRKAGERFTPEEITRGMELKRKLTLGRRNANLSISELVRMQFTLTANATPGDHEIRVRTPAGLSNPLIFCVGQYGETSKPDWKTVPVGRNGTESAPVASADATVKLPAVVNGQIAPAGLDRYHFAAQKGQQLVVAVDARRLIPYLADAVPGWFEAALTILDPNGKELASAERYQFRPDPVIHFEVPQDGTYTVEIRDSLYRGREDFVYRMSIGELPFVTSIFPLGGEGGKKVPVTLTGWNLAVKNLTLNTSTVHLGIASLPGNFFNAVPFTVDNLPECFERQPESEPVGHKSEPDGRKAESAQAVTLPIVVNGRISRPGEGDVYKFTGRSGQQIVAEIFARRLGSPLDSFLRLTDASGKQIAFNDDFEDKGSGLETHHADSYISTTLPAAGTYFLRITDTQGQGGAESAYRLRISEPQPDFALRVVPSCINVRAGATVQITVFALRKHNFKEAISLGLNSGPPGATLDGGRIPAGQDQARMTVTVPQECAPGSYAISMEGHATIGARDTRHLAIPADDMMQAFIYQHLVSAKEQIATVLDPGRFIPRLQLAQSTPIKLRTGEATRVHFTTSFNNPAGLDQISVELSDPPPGVTIESTIKEHSGLVLLLKIDPEKAKLGGKGNLILESYFDRTPQAAAGKPAGKKQHILLGTLPAIPFEF